MGGRDFDGVYGELSGDMKLKITVQDDFCHRQDVDGQGQVIQYRSEHHGGC